MKQFLENISDEMRKFSSETGQEYRLETKQDYIVVSLQISGEPFQVLFAPRDENHKHFSQSKCFNIFYRNSGDAILNQEQEKVIERLTKIVAEFEQDLTLEEVSQFFEKAKEPVKPAQPAATIPKVVRKTGTLKLASKCNTNCFFCNSMTTLKSQFTFLDDLKQITRLLDRMLDEGCEVVSFDGGEPTMSPVLKEALQYARNLGFADIGMVTNGIRLADERYLLDLHQAGLTAISFSMHASDSETSRQIYGQDHTQAQLQALKNIKKLSQSIALSLQVVLVAQNVGTLKQLLDLFVSYNPGEVILIYCIPPGSRRHGIKPPFLPDSDDGTIINQARQFKEKYSKVRLSLRNFPYCKVPAELWENIQGFQALPKNLKRKQKKHTKVSTNYDICLSCENRSRCDFPLQQYIKHKSGNLPLLLDNLLRIFGYDYLSQKFRKGS